MVIRSLESHEADGHTTTEGSEGTEYEHQDCEFVPHDLPTLHRAVLQTLY